MKKRKICVVTTSRADYGHLKTLMGQIRGDSELALEVIVSGSHLSREFGYTAEAIERDGFPVAKKIEMLLSSDTETSAVKSIGVGLISFAGALSESRPDILVLLGDRYEILCPAVAALLLRIPVAHIHGGESSEGAIDDAVRHCVTKIATYHFPAARVYRERIIQMGEEPGRVFAFGAPGLDHLHGKRLLTRRALQKALDFDLGGRVAIVTYHPATLRSESPVGTARNIVRALERTGLRAVFTKSNADPNGVRINEYIGGACAAHPGKFKFFDNLGQDLYLSCLKHLDLMIGNSSSGLIEGPTLKIPVVNIGRRQDGRVKAGNVIDTGTSGKDIARGIGTALSGEFARRIAGVANPYDLSGDGKTSLRIKETLKAVPLGGDVLRKRFHDLSRGHS
jgi:UDP-N-acetylglucosamine 2-epimerase (non-hydrolysing)/GDP/UDP-N,N'-diacetylbacillosamine 2-epimerase (hydrolysing)